ncbi:MULTISPECIES: TetR/AcrR family transcriptional regulator [unclassified Corallococcus]|uniref:TetR/AcrR family transcriptional regulator n=1 Tax=unclassified Corallococcus TaxID=2685029 RepID=UPI001A903F1C|nr:MULTISPECIES: TetR/AcrR family transcriptional regulator [unclassified Corallococcus]MBN9682133.1 TetR/AcrR family transcriptional regulator [Corallococcus sp. NCSPR001]WAS86306.1 helix-turn-helix domain containing protein [Corallococcus sp. NCRR]
MTKQPKNPQEDATGGALRADARRNRERLLVAAHDVFSERGADASLADVAKRAEVGIGTLYRHFESREALLAATCDEQLLTLAKKSRERSESLPALEALRVYLEELAHSASMYKGLAASLGIVLKNHTEGCDATTAEGERLLKAAQHAGEVRSDVLLDDVVCMAMAISLAVAENASGPKRVHRLTGMFFDGLRSRPEPRSTRQR